MQMPSPTNTRTHSTQTFGLAKKSCHLWNSLRQTPKSFIRNERVVILSSSTRIKQLLIGVSRKVRRSPLYKTNQSLIELHFSHKMPRNSLSSRFRSLCVIKQRSSKITRFRRQKLGRSRAKCRLLITLLCRGRILSLYNKTQWIRYHRKAKAESVHQTLKA